MLFQVLFSVLFSVLFLVPFLVLFLVLSLALFSTLLLFFAWVAVVGVAVSGGDQDEIASSLMVFFIFWQEKKATIDYNIAYSSVYYEILFKGCTLYPSFLSLLRRSNNLQW